MTLRGPRFLTAASMRASTSDNFETSATWPYDERPRSWISLTVYGRVECQLNVLMRGGVEWAA